jgi:hypothetical protein
MITGDLRAQVVKSEHFITVAHKTSPEGLNPPAHRARSESVGALRHITNKQQAREGRHTEQRTNDSTNYIYFRAHILLAALVIMSPFQGLTMITHTYAGLRRDCSTLRWCMSALQAWTYHHE